MGLKTFIGLQSTTEVLISGILLANVVGGMSVSLPGGLSVSFSNAAAELSQPVYILLLIVTLAFIAAIFLVSSNAYQASISDS